MARIRIDDLPVAENLTLEQEALILGAGLKSFRPSLEALEDRYLMSANFVFNTPPTNTSGNNAGIIQGAAPRNNFLQHNMTLNDTSGNNGGIIQGAAPRNNFLQHNMRLNDTFAKVDGINWFSNSHVSPQQTFPEAARGLRNQTPWVSWDHVPPNAGSLVLIVEDISVRDNIPGEAPGRFTHMVVYNISPDARSLSDALAKGATVGRPYQGPNPPPGETHTYEFKLYALETRNLQLSEGQSGTAQAMRTALQGQTIIGQPAQIDVRWTGR